MGYMMRRRATSRWAARARCRSGTTSAPS
jgi:hypothetical protein